MRRLELHRRIDASGVSGTGVVAQGVESDSGKVALFWLTAPRSVVIFDSPHDVLLIHGHGGDTELVYIDRSLADAMRENREARADAAGTEHD